MNLNSVLAEVEVGVAKAKTLKGRKKR